jgi:isopentenyldiphosphate isomerase
VAIEPFGIVDAIQINPILFKHEHNSSCPVYKTQETTSAQLEPDQAEAFSWISEEFQNVSKVLRPFFFVPTWEAEIMHRFLPGKRQTRQKSIK